MIAVRLYVPFYTLSSHTDYGLCSGWGKETGKNHFIGSLTPIPVSCVYMQYTNTSYMLVHINNFSTYKCVSLVTILLGASGL